jgi:hypothetical protein
MHRFIHLNLLKNVKINKYISCSSDSSSTPLPLFNTFNVKLNFIRNITDFYGRFFQHKPQDIQFLTNRLMSIIDMGDTSTKSRYFINDWYLEQIFSLYTCTCNYGFIYLQILV